MEGLESGRPSLATLFCFLIVLASVGGVAARLLDRDASGTYTDPGNQFRVQVPDGWSQGTDVDGVWLRASGSNAVLKIMPDAGCAEGTSAAALQVIAGRIELYSANPEFRILEPPVQRTVHGHAAATAFAAHSESSSPVYILLAVILGPEWATVWTFAGFMNGASELALSSTMNTTFESFEPLVAPGSTTLPDADGRFTIGVHPGWTGTAGAMIGGVRVDAIIATPIADVSVVVGSEGSAVTGSYESALPILQETLDNLSAKPGYRILEALRPIALDGHPAAQATVSWQPSTYDVVQVLAVVPAPEWGRYWGFVGTMFSWDAAAARSCVDATISSFHFLAAPPSIGIVTGLQAAYPWLLGGALIATAVEGFVLGVLIYRQRRRPTG